MNTTANAITTLTNLHEMILVVEMADIELTNSEILFNTYSSGLSYASNQTAHRHLARGRVSAAEPPANTRHDTTARAQPRLLISS
jgi:hypothetical protein